MPSGFANFILNQDRLGQGFSLNYRGNKTHRTWLGSVLSIATSVLVLVILVQKSI